MDFISSSLRLNKKQAVDLLTELEKKDYIEKDQLDYGEQYWHNTISGNALGGASATKSYKRKTAKKALNEFMERVHKVNTEPYYHIK